MYFDELIKRVEKLEADSHPAKDLIAEIVTAVENKDERLISVLKKLIEEVEYNSYRTHNWRGRIRFFS